MASATVVAIGLWIGLERGQLVDALRNVLQAMCRFLLPLTVLILLLFVVCLPFTGLQPLWETRHATPILLAMVFAHVALLNGVVQDGRQAVHYPRALRVLVDASSCACRFWPVLRFTRCGCGSLSTGSRLIGWWRSGRPWWRCCTRWR